MLEEKLVKRKVSLKVLDYGKVEEATKGAARQTVSLKVGINDEKAREIGKYIKGLGLKGVQHQVQGDQLRVTGKKRDDLQKAIAVMTRTRLRRAAAVHELPRLIARGSCPARISLTSVSIAQARSVPTRSPGSRTPRACATTSAPSRCAQQRGDAEVVAFAVLGEDRRRAAAAPRIRCATCSRQPARVGVEHRLRGRLDRVRFGERESLDRVGGEIVE